MNEKGMIYFFSGKMGSGKTTYALKLTDDINGNYLSEDDLLSSLFPDKIKTFNDYITYSVKIKPQVKDLVQSLVKRGKDVVMDFPGNTVRQRKWFMKLINELQIKHQLIYLKTNDELCLKQISKRAKEQPERQKFDTKEVFNEVTKFFQEPTDDEGFNILVITK